MNVFADDQFTPTKWSTAEEKASFANDLLAFIMSGFPKTKFTQKLYQRLSNCFSHIAEYDRDNFYAVWFSSAEARHSFLRNLSNAPCFGDPTWTFSDVERAVKQKVGELGLERNHDLQAAAETRQRELALLAALQAKYSPAQQVPVATEASMPAQGLHFGYQPSLF
jgi:hypothetical protein